MKLPWDRSGDAGRSNADRTLRVLLIDDDKDEYRIVRDAFRDFDDTNFELEWVDTFDAGLEKVKAGEHDVYLVDYRLGGANGVDLVRSAREAGIKQPMIMLTGQREREVDMAAMEAGASDYLVKGRTDPALLERTIRYTLMQADAAAALERSLAQVQGLEWLGHLLAESGPTEATLQQLLTFMAEQLEQHGAALYLMERGRLELAAERGYPNPLPTLDAGGGRLAGLLQRGVPAMVPAVGTDPESLGDAARTWSEFAIPLMNRTTCTGLLLVARPDGEPLPVMEHHTVLALADRLAVGLALTDEREELLARASRTNKLLEFAQRVGATPSAGELPDTVVGAAGSVVSSDLVLLATRDDGGRDVVRAASGAAGAVGLDLRRATTPDGMAVGSGASHHAPDPVIGDFAGSEVAWMDVRLDADGHDVGRMLFVRRDPRSEFGAGEQEAARMMAALVAMAVRNAEQHATSAAQSVRDPVTQMPNRAFFELALAQLAARRARQDPAERRPIAAALYELDLAPLGGRPNDADDALRTFASALAARTRDADVVARYGDASFAVVLVNATRDETARITEEVLAAFRDMAEGSTTAKVAQSARAGVSEVGPDDVELDGLLSAASMELALARRA